MGEHPPKQVLDALHSADHDALSRMGKAGAKKAAEKRAERQKQHLAEQQREEDIRAAIFAENLREAAEAQSKLYQVNPEGDVVAPDTITPFKMKPSEEG